MHGYSFPETTRHALAQARTEAADRHHQYVGPEHLLLALVHLNDRLCAGVLASFHLDAAAVEREVTGRLDRSTAGATGPELPYTSRAKKVLEFAMLEAANLRHAYVGTEHLLLGIIREEGSVAAEALADLGVELETARLEVVRLLGQSGEPIVSDKTWAPWLTGVGPLTRQLTDILADVTQARTPEQILAALLADNGGARHILEHSGVDVEALRAEITQREVGARGAATSMRELMAAALAEQKYLGDCALASHHVLLAYLALRPAHGYRALNVTHARVRGLAEKIFG